MSRYKARNSAEEIASRSPRVLEFSIFHSEFTIKYIPTSAIINAGIIDNLGNSFKINIDNSNPKNGCILSKNIEFAIVVICMDAIQVTKCAARKNPANIKLKLKFLNIPEVSFFRYM